MRSIIFRGSRGQTAVEYLLMTLVMMTFSVMLYRVLLWRLKGLFQVAGSKILQAYLYSTS
jgi:hypothetical protein